MKKMMIPPTNTSNSLKDTARDYAPNEIELSSIALELARIGETELSVAEIAHLGADSWDQQDCLHEMLSIFGSSQSEADSGPHRLDSRGDSKPRNEGFSEVQQQQVWGKILGRIEGKHPKLQVEQRLGRTRMWTFASVTAVAASLICIWMVGGRSDSGLRDIGKSAHDMLQGLPSLDGPPNLIAGQSREAGAGPDRWAQHVAKTMLDRGQN